MPDRVRLLIADDHAVVRQGLRLFLALHDDVQIVGEATDGRDALAQALELAPDVVLMDVEMPQLDGIQAAAALHEQAPDVRVLMLSSYDDEQYVLPALRAGATGYLHKSTAPEELLRAIHATSRGEPVLSREACARVIGAVRGSHRRPEGTVTVVFTDIERSTPLLESLGEERAREVFREHGRVVRNAVAEWDGTEVETAGDAFMLAFTSARKAVSCAADIQRSLERDGPAEVALRIGLNTGDVISDEDRYFGRAVFVASRIAGLAEGREILVSDVTRKLAGDGELPFRDRGRHVLRGLKGEHRVFEVEWNPSAS